MLAAVAVIALGWDAALLSRGGIVQTAGAEEAMLSRVAPGEGAYDEEDRVVAQLLAEPGPPAGPPAVTAAAAR